MTHRRTSSRPRRAARQGGSALLLAMIILAVVATLTAGMVWQQRRAIDIETAERARVQAAWILLGALDWATLILREDLRNRRQGGASVDSLDEPWATPLAEARLSTFLAAEAGGLGDDGPEAFLSGAIVDAQSRFNLRGLVDASGQVQPVQLAALDRLCGLVGLQPGVAQRLADGLVAAMGAGQGGPELAPLSPSRLADFRWMGIEPELLAQLAPYVDLLPVPTPVNANTAPREVLVAAIDGLDLGSAERLLQRRQREPFSTLQQLQAELPQGATAAAQRVGVASNHFEVAGRLRLEERVLEEVSLLQRRAGARDDVVVLRRERRSFTLPTR